MTDPDNVIQKWTVANYFVECSHNELKSYLKICKQLAKLPDLVYNEDKTIRYELVSTPDKLERTKGEDEVN